MNFRKCFFLLGFLLISPLMASSHSPGLEALGLSQDTRALIIHADDMGMCYSEETASFEAMTKGSVTSGSAMVPCSWFPETVENWKANPQLDIGLHLTLTSEWKVYRWGPVAGRDAVPLLVDDEGYLWRNVFQVYTKVEDNIDQVETEIQAQIDLARKLGLEPTHMDSHMGTLYYNHAFFKATCNLALKNDIPFMVFNYSEDVSDQAASKLPYYTKETAQSLIAAGFPVVDGFYGEELVVKDDYEAGLKNYADTFSNLKPGVNFLLLHMGIDGPELQNVTGRHWARDQQYRIFTDPRMAEHLKKENIKLINWRDLKEAVWDKRDKSIEKVFD
jgi:predicted glycoside hydrolase/deacetylase ChbG (UPF0249 family)